MKNNPYQIVRDFEEMVAEYAGSKYAVAVESGTAAIFLSLMYIKSILGAKLSGSITIPKFTYPSVACSIIHAGFQVKFTDKKWKGVYDLEPYKITDGALRFKKGMYKGGLHCLSFHVKKLLPIGRGGMVLTDDRNVYDWLKLARFDGREEAPLEDMKQPTVVGFNMYLMPEQAARGITLFNTIKNKNLEDLDMNRQGYPDLSRFDIFK